MELPKAIGKPDHCVAFEKSPKRMRVIVEDTTIADTVGPGLMFETGHRPVYYFPRKDVRMDLLERTEHRTHCPYKGDASYWTIKIGDRRIENAVWSYEQPLAEIVAIKDYLAFYWTKVDHWIEEDEEIFGHARDPYSRVDVRPSSREVRVTFNGETIAHTAARHVSVRNRPPDPLLHPATGRADGVPDSLGQDHGLPLQGHGVLLVGAGRRPGGGRRSLGLSRTAARLPADCRLPVLLSRKGGPDRRPGRTAMSEILHERRRLLLSTAA